MLGDRRDDLVKGWVASNRLAEGPCFRDHVPQHILPVYVTDLHSFDVGIIL